MERQREIKKMYEINLYCDNCGKPMLREDVVLATYPPKYNYECKQCNVSKISTALYPYIKYEYGKEETIGKA